MSAPTAGHVTGPGEVHVFRWDGMSWQHEQVLREAPRPDRPDFGGSLGAVAVTGRSALAAPSKSEVAGGRPFFISTWRHGKRANEKAAAVVAAGGSGSVARVSSQARRSRFCATCSR